MARIRTIKPEFFTSEDVCGLSPMARLLFIALWCEADREGRLDWRPGTFKLRYFPADDCDIAALCAELLDCELVIAYEVDGKKYAEIPSFSRHQVINNRESESHRPSFFDASGTRVHASQGKEGRKEGKEGKGREGRVDDAGAAAPPPKLDFSSWPEQPKPETLKDWIAHRKRKKSPVSQTVINRLSGKLAACVAKGYSVDDCLAESVTRGWLGLELEWLENAGVKPSRKAAEVKSRDDPLMAAKREAQDLHSRIKADRDLGLDPPADSVARLDELQKFIKGFGRGS